MKNNYFLPFTAQDAALLLIDFQPQMFMGLQSHNPMEVFNNVQILAKGAKLFGMPVVLTTITANSFAGPFISQVTEVFPDQAISDRSSINAWLDPNFVAAVEATGRKRLIIAGLWTGACAAFNVLGGLSRDYEVYFVADACADTSLQVHERAVERMIQAGATPLSAQHFLYELQQDWARQETYQGVMDIIHAHSTFGGIQVPFSKWALSADHDA